MAPASIGLLKHITIHWGLGKSDMRQFAFLAPLQYATTLQVLQFQMPFGYRPPRDNALSDQETGRVFADNFYKKMSPFVRAFAAHRGVEAILKVVKFHTEDVRSRLVLEPWNENREKVLFRGMKERLVELVGHEHARVRSSA